MEFLEAFIEDCKYYDIKRVEVKTIVKSVNLKNKTILDIGTGIGRLAFPLSKYAKEIIALEKDRRFKRYFDEHKNRKIKFVNQSAEKFLGRGAKFDVILLAWPTIKFRCISLIKKAVTENTRFIFITCDNNSDFEKTINKLEGGSSFDRDIRNKKKFISLLPKNFKIISRKTINTEYVYPSQKTAFRVIKNSMNLWFKTKFNKEKEEKLKEIIKKHKKDNKIIFREKIWFYLMANAT
jgi:protein-L-isoaspartate O-methyltransferase